MTSKKSKNIRATATKKGSKLKVSKPNRDGAMSALDAAARVLKENGAAMNCKQMIEAMLAKKYWKTSGKTPANTLYSAVLREITTKGKESRFKKSDRGNFTIAS